MTSVLGNMFIRHLTPDDQYEQTVSDFRLVSELNYGPVNGPSRRLRTTTQLYHRFGGRTGPEHLCGSSQPGGDLQRLGDAPE